MALIGAGPVYVGGTSEFLLLRGLKHDAQSTITRKPRLWSHVAITVA